MAATSAKAPTPARPSRPSAGAKTLVDRSLFDGWKSTVQVRNVQRKFDEIEQSAKANSCSIDDELKRQGFKDYADFAKSCKRFSLLCWPEELGELGSGYVLYFYLLGFMAMVLLLALLMQIPAFAAYADEDQVEAWQEGCTNCEFIGRFWLTPGNFGPDRADNKVIGFVYLALVCVIAFLILVMHQWQLRVDSKIDGVMVSPNDFAIMVSGLPVTATDEKAIMEFFRQHAVKGQTDTEIVKVVIGWDIEEFREKIKRIRELRKLIAELEPSDPQVKVLKEEQAKTTSELASAAPGKAAKLRSSGTVVVVFRYQHDLRKCLDRWTGFWASWFYCDSEDLFTSCGLPAGNALWMGAGLPRFPMGDPPRPVARLSVIRAANPGDIHWEELGKSFREKFTLFAKTNAAMVFLIVVCFFITFGINKAQDALADSQESTDDGGAAVGFQALSFVAGIGVGVTNMILMVASRYLGDLEYHETWTEQEFSQAVKMGVSLLINTGGVLLGTNLEKDEWYRAGGLIDDMKFVLLIDAILPPFIFFIDLKYRIRYKQRRMLTQERMNGWNETVGRIGAQPRTPAEAAELSEVKQQINVFKAAFEPSMMDNPRRYANAMNSFLCTLLFSPIFPIAPAIGLVGITLQYWMDKYLLLRWYRRPKRPYNMRLAQWSLRYLKYVSLIGLSIFFLVFLLPTWQDNDQIMRPFMISIGVAAVMVLVPSTVFRTLLGLRCLLRVQGFEEKHDGRDDYYNAQHLWSTEMKYHKDHFLYKCLPEAKNPEILRPDVDAALKAEDLKSSYGAGALRAAAGEAEDPSKVALRGGRVLRADAASTGGSGGAAPVATAAYGASAASKAAMPGGEEASELPRYGARGQDQPAASDGSAPAVYGAAAGTAPASASYGAAAAPAPNSPSYGAAAAPSPDAPSYGAAPAAGAAPLAYGATAPPASEEAAPEAAPAGDSDGGAVFTAPTPVPPARSTPTGARIVWTCDTGSGPQPFENDMQEYMEKKYQEFKSSSSHSRCNVSSRSKGTTTSVDFAKMTAKTVGQHGIHPIKRCEE